MLAISSPEKRHHSSDLQRVKKTRKECVNFNQNSTEDESYQIESQFPISIFEDFLGSLSTIDLSKNKIDTLSESLFLVNTLKHLKIDKIGISSLPSKICNLKSLTYLDASENKIEDLPDVLGNLENLEILNLSFNKLSKLPLSCFALSHLKQLILSNNRFQLIPECVQEAMKNLEILEISNNPLRFISPPASTKLKRFTAKGLKHCRLFPEWLLNSKFWKLDEIILDESIFTKFCFQEISNSHLRSLSMTNSSLNDMIFQKITSKMVELEKINVDNIESRSNNNKTNKFCFLPGSNLKNPGRVKEIRTRLTALSILSRSIVDFSNLKRLDVGENKLCWLPNEICELRHLEMLIIDRCELYGLPKEFGKLDKLKEFVACNNRLTKLPESMADLQNLAILDLFDNEFSEMPTCLGGEQLRCLDLELNFFKINNPLIRNTPYVVLRERLRQHYNCERSVGSKAKLYRDDESYDFADMREADSCSESENGEIFSEINGCCSEDWSLTEDSADEYEPTREAKLKLPPARSLKQFHLNCNSYFRPSDLHSRRVREIVRQMKKKNLRINSTCTIEEGQFDDA